MEVQLNEVGISSLYTFMNVKDINLLPCENIGCGAKYFLAICYIMQSNYEKAEQLLEEILLIANNFIPNNLTTILLKSVYYYASGMNKLESHEEVMKYINLLFDSEIAQAIEHSFRKKEKILINHYNIKADDYVENDDAYYLPFMEILRKAQRENIIQQDKLKEIFKECKIKCRI